MFHYQSLQYKCKCELSFREPSRRDLPSNNEPTIIEKSHTTKCLPSSSRRKLRPQNKNGHCEITGDPSNLIGSQQCVVFINHTIFSS